MRGKSSLRALRSMPLVYGFWESLEVG
jgi:hypothetical protein